MIRAIVQFALLALAYTACWLAILWLAAVSWGLF